jgi:hypothetical protein
MTLPEQNSSKQPEQNSSKRRLQILDDETRDGREFNARAQEDPWVKNFMARLAGLVRRIGGKN